jgi:small-conductance mechanosensitive channel
MLGSTNNLVVIPNNKLGQAIFTNYSMPDRRMGMSISVGVGYDSDVARVELLLIEEALAAENRVAGLVADPPPNVRFIPGPGDFALVFQLNFSVAQFSDQYLVQSELRKRIFNRLRKEGITMPFPTRTVILEQPDLSQSRPAQTA